MDSEACGGAAERDEEAHLGAQEAGCPGLDPVPAEAYRMPERGAGAVHTWQGS